MRNKAGTVCMILGIMMVLAALGLFVWNRQEAGKAEAFAEKIMPRIIEQIEYRTDTARSEQDYPDPYDPAMTEAEIDGHTYIGYLSVPALNLCLPVMSQCSSANLKISPCRYSGSTKTGDLVVGAHNYVRFFGHISSLQTGAAVFFTDMDGVVWRYEVEELDTLLPTEVEEMTGSEYELTLFTCTYDRRNRVAVRCRQAGAADDLAFSGQDRQNMP